MTGIYNDNSSNVSKELKIITTGKHKHKSFLKAIVRYLTVLTWIKSYNFSYAKNDVISGFVMSIVVIPQCLAFSNIAGLPPKYAFFTAIVIPIVSFFFSSSMYLVNGPSIALSMVAFSIVSKYASPFSEYYIQLMLLLSFLVGVFQLVLFFLKFNFILKFISGSVIKAFTAGAAVLILLHEIGPILGMNNIHSHSILDIITYIFKHIRTDVNYWSLILSVFTILTWFILNIKINGGIAVFISIFLSSTIGIIISKFAGGYLPFEEPVVNIIPIIHIPKLTIESIGLIYKDAFLLAVIALILATSIASSLAEQTKKSISMRHEIVSQGMTNFIGGFFSTYISTGSFSRSALNYDCSGKTPIASVFSSIFTIIIVTFLGGIVHDIPKAVISGIVFLIGLRLIHLKSFIHIIKYSRTEKYTIAITFLSAIFINLQMAIYIGVLTSVLIFILKASAPRIYSIKYKQNTHTFASSKDGIDSHHEQCPQIVMIQVQGSIYFGSALYVKKSLSEIVKRNKKIFLLISGEGITSLDWDGAHVLHEKAEEWGKRMCVTGLAPNIKGTLKRYNINDKRLRFKNKTVAITYLLDKVDVGICKNCPRNVFKRCEKLKKQGVKQALKRRQENQLLS